ncbi:hydrogen peroxide-inducible genes activator [Niabella terrae]
MTLQQLEYILAVHQHRNFMKAAQACFVTQPTLSMQIQKLETEIGFKIFDRSKQPVIPTTRGSGILEHARSVVAASRELSQFADEQKGRTRGHLRIGIIPTLAPYLLPLFISSFIRKYPEVHLSVQELTTDIIVKLLKEGRIDAGILVTPLHENGINEQLLFYEQLLVYISRKNNLFNKEYVLARDIDVSKLWLLEEGHCFRSQIISLCELQKKNREVTNFEYEAGSIETLKRMVDINEGITIVPELAAVQMTKAEKLLLRNFKKPVPVREVSLVTHRSFLKKKLVDTLKAEIMQAVPESLKKNGARNIIAVD